MLTILFDIIVQPIIYVLEVSFSLLYRVTSSQGLSIIGVSLVVNLLCLPLYRMADEVQGAEREKQASMKKWVDHIKRSFSGDEQYMALSTYYDQQGYHPARALLGSLPLLLQIPFFMAAYTYLSGLELLNGASFWFMNDLGAPDSLLAIGGISINVLPVAMTALNCASTAIYTRGLPLRDKLQAYILAALFLVLLYDSPAGLVFYWTCNQLFSLGKNVVMKLLPHAGEKTTKDERVSSKKASAQTATLNPTPVFFLSAILLAALSGTLATSAVIADSPTEFVSAFEYVDPITYIVHATCVSAGLYVLWAGTYFLLAGSRARRVMAMVMVCATVCALIDYFWFAPNFGSLYSNLTYDRVFAFSAQELLLNLAAIASACALIVLLWRYLSKLLVPAMAVLTIALVALSFTNIGKINESVGTYMKNSQTDVAYFDNNGVPTPKFSLSRSGKNVIVLFMDRAMACYVPYIMDDRPELEQAFDGFVYYPNTLSFGTNTKFGSPALYGGYEYTPGAMNERKDLSVKDKHNEALKVLPALFSQNGWSATVVDPPYGNYQYVTDLSIYDDLAGVDAYRMTGAYSKYVRDEYGVEPLNRTRTIAFYAFMRVVPRFLQPTVYDEGRYCSTTSVPIMESFMDEWSVLHLLPQLTTIQEDGDTFLQLANCSTHEPDFLSLPDYEPAANVERTFVAQDKTHDGVTMHMDSAYKACHYEANMSALIQLGRWFDWMREQGVYDNTRIVIVSDHGRFLSQFDEQRIDEYLEVQMVNPLLMVKDFDAHGFSTSDEFMTNADTPAMALANVLPGAINPFTHKEITTDAKDGDQYVTASSDWRLGSGNETEFNTSDAPWYAVRDNIFDISNWHRLD